jgi:hypothetical protein
MGSRVASHPIRHGEESIFRKEKNCCQAAKLVTLGWLLLSSKTISDDTFLPALRHKLQMPYPIAIRLVQFWPILLPNGKHPPFDKDDPPPIELHLEIDEFYYGRYKKEITKIFRSGSRASINRLRLHLIPCFLAKGDHTVFDSDTTAHLIKLTLHQKQFLSSQLIEIRTKLFALLDTPLADNNKMTLRQHIML